ncbi:uncharacterized protein dbf4b isoform X2 [Cheilinus undulatus]|uniref:uncharacterized protein dbf4b isoform X2 n=1 Tax=Cheilinus undulatus TaxID=241271 RepID=UPI001BD2EB84|nr:uncharacterized protein dbf4b isoform X2 [Cheilinus undulatus]
MQKHHYAEKQGLLGSLCPGQKKLEGKIFYLDSVKKRATALLLEAISLLGGRVESFLHKDVSFVVTGSQEGQSESRCTKTKAGAKEMRDEAQNPITTRESALSNGKQRPGTPRPTVCGSRGKALLEKAIRNNERLKGSSVLANARSWGVKILFVDDVLLYLKQLTRESFSTVPKRPEKTYNKQQNANVVKAAALRSPYLKIEDMSRKYRPLHMQSMTFPTMCYSGRFSPFESPPAFFEKQTGQLENKTREKKKVESSVQDKSQTPVSCNPSPWRPRKKDVSYCECCHQHLNNLEEHLQSDQHRAFVLDPSNYTVVDQLVSEMLPGFELNTSQPEEEILNRPLSPMPMEHVCELEPLTDVETERAVQALQSFNTHIFDPPINPLPSGPASPSPGLQRPTPSTDVQPSTTLTDTKLPLSPAMPALDVEPQTNHLSHQLPGTHYLSPCLSSDPYPLPPVLSPQVSYPSHMLEPHGLYSEPPILSPQKYTVDDAAEGHKGENESQFVPDITILVSDPLTSCVALTNMELVKGSNQDSELGFRGIICSTEGLEYATPFSCRSRSLPRQSATAPNPKKRCRSASPDYSRSKKRRITEQGHESAELEKDSKVKPEGCVLLDKIYYPDLPSSPNQKFSSTCTGPLKQDFTLFSIPVVQNFTWTLTQNIHSSTSVDQPLWPPSSNSKIFDPPVHFNKSLSSQDSQHLQPLSTSVCIEPALIPDFTALSPSSSDSDWDCELLSHIGSTAAAPLSPAEQTCELDQELLHRPCTWMHDSSYESRLHTVLQPANTASSLSGDEMDPSVFSRTVVQVVEVQH